jgi:hypothetical protein
MNNSMTWRLIHDSETVGEWSDDLVNKIVKELTNRKKKSSLSKSEDSGLKEIISIVAEFFPDPIREVINT